jgi:tetratricopeptide (TPR) repeat protein
MLNLSKIFILILETLVLCLIICPFHVHANNNPVEQVFFDYADEQSRQTNFEAAVDGFTNVLEINPENTEAYFMRGLNLTRLGEYELAIQDFSEAIARSPKGSESYYWRAEARKLSGDRLGAVADYSRASQLKMFNTMPKFVIRR